jgi:hypothetical protein
VAAAPAGRRLGRPAGGPGTRVGRDRIGEYERAFYGSQYPSMAPLFEHYGIGLRVAGSRRAGRLARRGPRADHARARLVVQAGDHPDTDPARHRDGRPDQTRSCAPAVTTRCPWPSARTAHSRKAMLARGRVRPWSRGLTMPAGLPAGHLLPYPARPRRPDLASSGRTGRVLRVLPAARPRAGRARRGNRVPRGGDRAGPDHGVLRAGDHQWDRYGGHASGPGADHWGGT